MGSVPSSPSASDDAVIAHRAEDGKEQPLAEHLHNVRRSW